jgi:hypothetical protein
MNDLHKFANIDGEGTVGNVILSLMEEITFMI